MKRYHRIRDLMQEVEVKYSTGLSKGEDVGFKCLEDLYSVKLGCTTYIYGSPTSGKTEFWFEVLINLSQKYGWRHVIYSPETGSPSDIVIELMHKWAGKPFYDNLNRQSSTNRLTMKEIYSLSAILDEYFVIIDNGEYDFTISQFYETIDEIEKTIGSRIHTTTADPFNEFKHELMGEARDMYVEAVLGKIRRNARDKKRHNCIITHVTDQQLQSASTSDGRTVMYYPMATPRQIAYGQAWYRKGDAMICLWRPPYGVTDENMGHNRMHSANEVIVSVQKAKPKGIGEKGNAYLFFDPLKNRYYEFGNMEKLSFNIDDNKRYYAFEYKESLLKSSEPESRISESILRPSTQFDLEIDDQLPF